MKKIALFISLLLIVIILLPSCTQGIALSNVNVEKDFYSVDKPEPVNVTGTVSNVPVAWLDGIHANTYDNVKTTCTIYKYISPDQADPIGNPFYVDNHGLMTCPSSFNFSTAWNYNPGTAAGTYYVVVISNGYFSTQTEPVALSFTYDMIVLWDSKQAINGDVNAAAKKMKSAVKSIGNVQEQTQKYINAKSQDINIGNELVNVQGQQMTADEAYGQVQVHLEAAKNHMATANTLFNNQNYKLAFDEAQNAESEAQQGKQCGNVTSGQSGANSSSKKKAN